MSLRYDPFVILGVPPEALTNEVKAAYRKLARRLHPDVNTNPAAAQQFEETSEAYELLTDPGERKKLEAERQARQQQAVEDHAFTLQVTPSKRTIRPLEEPQVAYLLADILPDPNAHEELEKRDTTLNLTLVLDRSNSMRGSRIERVKAAASQIIDNMASNDIISIVTFNDRADVVIRATTPKDRIALKANASLMTASGGTEIYQGLLAGIEQVSQNLDPRRVNHILLLTDGRTFGDEKQCLELADKAAQAGISISAMGLGHDWNDEFLDTLAAKTGGNSEYINSSDSVVRFLNDHVRNLGNAFAERVTLSIAPDPDITLESAFRLSPHPQPLTLDTRLLHLGGLQIDRPISVLLQFQLPGGMINGYRNIARLVVKGDILTNRHQPFMAVGDLSLRVTSDSSSSDEETPVAILDALSKLTLYRLQERANEALEAGEIAEATRRLENLATRLFDMGQEDLGTQALTEARRIAHTSELSNKGRKTLKYQTRYLLTRSIDEDKLS